MAVDLNWWMKWVGCVLILIGAVLTSMENSPLNMVFLNLGAMCYVVWGVRIKEYSVVVVNLAVFIIYLVGFIASLL